MADRAYGVTEEAISAARIRAARALDHGTTHHDATLVEKDSGEALLFKQKPLFEMLTGVIDGRKLSRRKNQKKRRRKLRDKMAS